MPVNWSLANDVAEWRWNEWSAGFNSRHAGGAQFLMADGSARFFSDSTDLNTLRALATIDAGEVIGEF